MRFRQALEFLLFPPGELNNLNNKDDEEGLKPGKQETAQRVSIAKKIGLIGLVAASLLLCSAHSFEPVMGLYRAKPEDVPPWAEQGNFRFIRLDGGRIESWKAERTWWGKDFSAKEKDVLPTPMTAISSK